MFGNIVKLAAAVSLSVSAPALACSIFVDEPAEKTRLIRIAQAELGVQDSQVAFSEVRDFRFFESKPGPMCPEAISFTGSVLLWHTEKRCAETFEVTRTVNMLEQLDASEYVVRRVSGSCFDR